MNKRALFTLIGVVATISGIAAGTWLYLGRAAPETFSGPREKLTIAITHSSAQYALVLIAAENGYFKDAGLEVTFQKHTSGRDALNAALDKNADLATVAETPLVLATMRGQPVSIVTTLSRSGLDGIVARKDSNIATPADLEEKRIATPFGTTSHYVLDTILLYNNVPPDQVRIVNSSPDKLAEALAKGEVDAIAVWEPYLSAVREAVGEKGIVFRAHKLFGSTFNIAGRREYVVGHPDAMRKLVRALVRAEQFVRERPADAKVILARVTNVPQGVIERDWPQYTLQITLDQALLTLLDSQARWAIRNRMVPGDTAPNFLEVIYWDALESVAPGAVTIIR